MFTNPVVTASRGGATRGGATLTTTGREILDRYRDIERKSLERCRDDLDAIARLMPRGRPSSKRS
jgi:molybdate transport system regulatory protein